MEVLGMLGILLRHACTPDELQLMQLDHVEWQSGDERSLPHKFVVILARKTQYEMSTSKYASTCRAVYGISRFGKSMTAINAHKGFVVSTLNTILYHQESTMR